MGPNRAMSDQPGPTHRVASIADDEGGSLGRTTSEQPIRLTIAQIRAAKGRVEHNLRRVATEVESWSGRTDILVVPETFLSGYFVEGGVEEVARSAGAILRGLGSPGVDAPDLILGAYERDGGEVFNTAFHLTPGDAGWELVHRHRKTFLPTYGVFDEGRFVSAGRRIRAYDTRFGRMGLLICEEMLHALPPMTLALDGADLFVALAASPSRDYQKGRTLPGNLERWDLAGRAITLEHGGYLAVAQAIGSEGGKLFAGGSVVYGPGGAVDARAALFDEHHLEVRVSRARIARQRIRSPLLPDLRAAFRGLAPELARAAERATGVTAPDARPSLADSRASLDRGKRPEREEAQGPPRPWPPASLELNLPLLERALLTFLEDEVRRQRGFERVVVGVSGGVDSAVTLSLAVRSFGADAVTAILMPYTTSSPESLEHGRQVAEAVGVEPRVIPISAGIDAYIESEEPELSPLRRGNLAARFRAMVLWDQSAKLDALVLGTGNKSERLLGYYTWHADDSPPINPLGDLFKTQVLALAEHLGVPAAVIEKPPSADLVEGVHDEDELGVPYAVADPILQGLLEGYTPAELATAGFDRDAVDLVERKLNGTHWKRRLPSVAMVSSTSIGDFYLRPVDYR
ncbi:MAG: NAD(+) synthase [Gemmatimonadales bacterium]|nr:MAG: NAD(+) synthase [Gemmatimonadales bacterium]